jgi:hypothetical protein
MTACSECQGLTACLPMLACAHAGACFDSAYCVMRLATGCSKSLLELAVAWLVEQGLVLRQGQGPFAALTVSRRQLAQSASSAAAPQSSAVGRAAATCATAVLLGRHAPRRCQTPPCPRRRRSPTLSSLMRGSCRCWRRRDARWAPPRAPPRASTACDDTPRRASWAAAWQVRAAGGGTRAAVPGFACVG